MYPEDPQPFQELPQVRAVHWEDAKVPNEVYKSDQFLAGHEVHVWQMSTSEVPLSTSTALHDTLSNEEKMSALKYKFARDRSRYVISHGILRSILSRYVDIDPHAFRYEYGRYGKPSLTNQPKANNIHFNMSRSNDTFCYVISNMNEVGIDIERINYDLDWYSIAKLYFPPKERLYLESIVSHDKVSAFYYIWTRKEAYLKALGVGLSGFGKIVNSKLSKFNNKLTLVSFKFNADFKCCLAISPSVSKIRFFHYDYLQELEASL